MSTQTILKALQSRINYPLSEDSYNTALTDADLDGDAIYNKVLKKDVELCAAELILVVCTSGNVSEGGYSLSLGDKKDLMKIRAIYLNNWGAPDNNPDRPVVSAVKGKW